MKNGKRVRAATCCLLYLPVVCLLLIDVVRLPVSETWEFYPAACIAPSHHLKSFNNHHSKIHLATLSLVATWKVVAEKVTGLFVLRWQLIKEQNRHFGSHRLFVYLRVEEKDVSARQRRCFLLISDSQRNAKSGRSLDRIGSALSRVPVSVTSPWLRRHVVPVACLIAPKSFTFLRYFSEAWESIDRINQCIHKAPSAGRSGTCQGKVH